MRADLKYGLVLLILLSVASPVAGSVPGDINGDNVVSQEELQTAAGEAKDGKITSEQLEEIKHISENYPRTITDSANRTVTIYKPIERIIAFGGYDVEMLYLVGDKEKVVGVASWFKDQDFRRLCFPEASEKPAPGTASSPDNEAILELHPDVITCWASNAEKLSEQLPDNITVIGLDFFNPDTFINESEKFAYVLENEGALDRYVEGFYSRYMNLIKERTKDLPEDRRPKVYWERQKPYETFGKSQYITSLIDICGGRNIFSDQDFRIYVVDGESVVKQNPDVIIRYAASKGPETGYSVDDPSAAKDLRDSVIQRQELAQTGAVKGDRVYVLNMGLPLGIQGPIGAVYAAKIIQPDLFKDIDPREVAQELITDYLGAKFDAREHGVFVYPALDEK